MDLQDRREIVDNIQYLVHADELAKLKNIIIDVHPADLADIIREMENEDRGVLFSLLSTETASDVLLELDEVTREHVVQKLEEGRLSRIIDEMDSDDAADVVSELPEELVPKVLSSIDTQDRAEVETLLVHDEESAGGIMALEFVAVYEDEMVDDAIQEIRQKAQEVEHVYNVYAIDRGGRLVGVISLKKLILVQPRTLIRDVMKTDVISVTVEKDQEEVASLVRKYDLVSVPVVDHYNRLVGRITIDDIVDVLQDEANEDLDRMAGFVDEEILQEMSTFRISKNRLPWLIVGFIGELCSALVMKSFDRSIQQTVATAFFIPLMMAMGGNAGIQSSTIVVRSIALAEGGATDRWSRFYRELRVSLLNGIIIGILLFCAVYIWMNEPYFGLVIAVAMLVVIMNAAAVGALVPFVLTKFKYDPAIATGPFITTTNDVVGLAIYLGLVTFYLNHFG